MKIVIIGIGSVALGITNIISNERNYRIAGFVGTNEEDKKFRGKKIYKNFSFLGTREILKDLKKHQENHVRGVCPRIARTPPPALTLRTGSGTRPRAATHTTARPQPRTHPRTQPRAHHAAPVQSTFNTRFMAALTSITHTSPPPLLSRQLVQAQEQPPPLLRRRLVQTEEPRVPVLPPIDAAKLRASVPIDSGTNGLIWFMNMIASPLNGPYVTCCITKPR